MGLQLLCLYFVFNFNGFHRASIINSSSVVIGDIYDINNDLTDYFKLKKENETLAKHNAELLNNQLKSFKLIGKHFIEINDTYYRQQYKYTAVKVINSTVHQARNFITLDKGSYNGIEPGMAVISQRGIIGIVKNVSNNYATVLSVLNDKFDVFVKSILLANSRSFFSCSEASVFVFVTKSSFLSEMVSLS